MRRSWGRVRACAAVASLTITAPSLASAQANDEVIIDPELSGGGGGSSAPASSGDEVISDPELGGSSSSGTSEQPPAEANYGWGEVYGPKGQPKSGDAPSEPAVEEDSYDPLANTGIAKIEVLGQTAIDMHPEYAMEDFYETRLRFGGEVDFRISRKLRLALGTRLDFFWAAPHQNDPYLKRQYQPRNASNSGPLLPDGRFFNKAGEPTLQPDGTPLILKRNETALDQDRYEVDIVPLAAYVDMTVAEGVHLRLGTQVVSLGRMDGFSATDILAVFDLRPQPKLDPAATKLAQPALRLDWDITNWMTLQAVYVPWFMPHVIRPTRDQFTGTVLTGPGSQGLANGAREVIEPSNQTKATESVVRYLGPAPDFRHPQAEARLNMRGGTFEVALLGGTAIEKIPSYYYVPRVGDALLTYDSEQRKTTLAELAQPAVGDRSLIDVAYHRYYLLGVDGSFDIAPLQVGFELSYSPERHLYASSKDGKSPPLPNTTQQICNPIDFEAPADAETCRGIAGADYNGNLMNRSIRKGVGLTQATLHVEWVKSDNFVIAGEAYYIQALERPHDRDREWSGFTSTGAFVGGLIGGNYLINDGQWRIDLTALATSGWSLVVSPQIEYRVFEGLYLNVGAQVFEGTAPNLSGITQGVAATNVTLGGLFSGYDNYYLGFRWLP